MEKVVVLLSAYNGEKYIMEQLESLYHQEGVEVEILVRDDGSSDATREILQREQDLGRLTWYTGENLRPAKSFLNLVENAPESKYYAFCDQDDFWMPDKLKIAVDWLSQQDPAKPLLYYGRPRLVDGQLKHLEKQQPVTKMLTFESMLINSQCTGCTMAFNDVLLHLARQSKPGYIAMHDSWLHKICIVAGGALKYDEDVHILYRQHGNNVVGATQSPVAKLKRRLNSLKKADCVRSRTVSELVKFYGSQMTAEQKEMADKVANYKQSASLRLSLLLDPRIKTGYRLRDLMYKLAVLMGAF